MIILKTIWYFILSHLDPSENDLMSEMGWNDYKTMKLL